MVFPSHPVKFVEEFDQRPFFDPGHIGAGDAQFPGDFPLGFFLAAVQSEAVSDHFLFPRIEDVQVVVYSFLFDLGLDRFDHLVPVRAEDIDQRDFVYFNTLSVEGIILG